MNSMFVPVRGARCPPGPSPPARDRCSARRTCPSPARPSCRTPARTACTPAASAARRPAGRTPSAVPPTAAPGVPGSSPGRGIRPVGEPQRQVRRSGDVHDVDALQQVVQRLAAHRRVRVADAAQPVVVLLEHVRVDRPDLDPPLPGVRREVAVVGDRVPRDVQRHRRRHPGEAVHDRRVVDLLVGVARHALLREHLEPGARVAVRPRRRLDVLRAQRLPHGRLVDHGCSASPELTLVVTLS